MNKKEIIIIGFGGHGKVVYNVLLRTKLWRIVGYIDNQDQKLSYIKYLGDDNELSKIRKKIKYAAIGIGQIKDYSKREQVYLKLKNIGYELPVIIAKSSIIMKNTIIGEGSFLAENTYLGPDVQIGKMAIINTGAVIEHESVIGDFVHISLNASLGGNTIVNDHSFIGLNAAIINGIKVGRNVIIGAGAVVNKDTEDNVTMAGVPACVKN